MEYTEKKKEQLPSPATPSEEVVLLTEIRDLLCKARNTGKEDGYE